MNKNNIYYSKVNLWEYKFLFLLTFYKAPSFLGTGVVLRSPEEELEEMLKCGAATFLWALVSDV